MQIESLTIIDETDELAIGHFYETAYLIKKPKGEILLEDDFIGDIQCGIIDRNNKWAILGGTHLFLWKPNSLKKYQTNEFRNIHSIRLKGESLVEILTDPWDTFSAIWELNIENGELIKRKIFTKYLGEAYTEEVSW